MTFRVNERQIKPKKAKQRRIYLTEPHDYFGVNYVLKMQERQRQLAKEGSTRPRCNSLSDCPSSPGDSCKPINGIVPSKCWRAYDLHNKPRGLYSEEEKKIAALEASYYKRTAVSVPLKEVWTNRFKSFFSSLTGRKMDSVPLVVPNSTSNCPEAPIICNESESKSSSVGCLSMQSNRSSNSKNSDGIQLTRHVHFAPQTVFCERNTSSSFWKKMNAKKRQKTVKKSEIEEMHYPRPFLPYLESGLTYCDDEEFYRLKNSNAHRNPQIILAQRNNRHREGHGHCLQAVFRALRSCYCCFIPKGRTQRRANYEWSIRNSGNKTSRSHSYRTRRNLHEKYL